MTVAVQTFRHELKYYINFFEYHKLRLRLNKVLNYDRQRKSEEGTISIEVSNTLSKDIEVRLIEHIYGDWVVRDASTNYRKKDASTIHFPINISANTSETVTYTYRKEWK